MDMNLGKLQEMVRDGEAGVRQSMGSQTVRHSLATEQSRTTDWTAVSMNHFNFVFSFTTLNKAQTNSKCLPALSVDQAGSLFILMVPAG